MSSAEIHYPHEGDGHVDDNIGNQERHEVNDSSVRLFPIVDERISKILLENPEIGIPIHEAFELQAEDVTRPLMAYIIRKPEMAIIIGGKNVVTHGDLCPLVSVPEVNRLLKERGNEPLSQDEEDFIFRSNYTSYIDASIKNGSIRLRIENDISQNPDLFKALHMLRNHLGVSEERIKVYDLSGSPAMLKQLGLMHYADRFNGNKHDLQKIVTDSLLTLDIEGLHTDLRHLQPDLYYHFARGGRCYSLRSLRKMQELAAHPQELLKVLVSMQSHYTVNKAKNNIDYGFLLVDEEMKPLDFKKNRYEFLEVKESLDRLIEDVRAHLDNEEFVIQAYESFYSWYASKLPDILVEEDGQSFSWLGYTAAYIRNEDPHSFDTFMKASLHYMSAYTAGSLAEDGCFRYEVLHTQETEKVLNERDMQSLGYRVFKRRQGNRMFQYVPLAGRECDPVVTAITYMALNNLPEQELEDVTTFLVAEVQSKFDTHNPVIRRAMREDPSFEQKRYILTLVREDGKEKHFYLEDIETYKLYSNIPGGDVEKERNVTDFTKAQAAMFEVFYKAFDKEGVRTTFSTPEVKVVAIDVPEESGKYATKKFLMREFVVGCTPKELRLQPEKLSHERFKRILEASAQAVVIDLVMLKLRGHEDDIILQFDENSDELLKVSIPQTQTALDADRRTESECEIDTKERLTPNALRYKSFELQTVLPAYLIKLREVCGASWEEEGSALAYYTDCLRAAVCMAKEFEATLPPKDHNDEARKNFLMSSSPYELNESSDTDAALLSFSDFLSDFATLGTDDLILEISDSIVRNIAFFDKLTLSTTNRDRVVDLLRKSSAILSLVGLKSDYIANDETGRVAPLTQDHLIDHMLAVLDVEQEQVDDNSKVLSMLYRLDIVYMAVLLACCKAENDYSSSGEIRSVPDYLSLCSEAILFNDSESFVTFVRKENPNIPVSDERIRKFFKAYKGLERLYAHIRESSPMSALRALLIICPL